MLRVPLDDLAEGELTLNPEAARYVARAHRKKPGDVCLFFDPARSIEAEATIVSVEQGRVICHVGPLRPASVRPPRDITLIQAIGKGDKVDAIVRDATELGVTHVVAIESARAVVRLGERAPARIERWRRIAVEAARQCGRGDAPSILGPEGLEEAVSRYRDADALKLCFWERASAPVGPYLQSLRPAQPVVVLVGPEGGLDASEIESAERAGFHSVSLGPLILRTETVATAVLGALLLCGHGA